MSAARFTAVAEQSVGMIAALIGPVPDDAAGVCRAVRAVLDAMGMMSERMVGLGAGGAPSHRSEGMDLVASQVLAAIIVVERELDRQNAEQADEFDRIADASYTYESYPSDATTPPEA